MQMHIGQIMISLPAIPEITLVTDLFPHAAVAYGYAKDTGYFRLKRLEAREGYPPDVGTIMEDWD